MDGKELAYPRVLIVSNECLSQSNSNGRTLRNFLLGWPAERLAQFYLHGNAPDRAACGRYFRVTDGQALRAFLGRGPAGGVVPVLEGAPAPAARTVGKKPSRTALTMLMRELVWSSRRWSGGRFEAWVEEFAPQLVLLQAGDCAFLLRLAEEMAREYQIPLVIYNSEAYYFKTFDYFRSKGPAHWCYPLFHRLFCRQFERTLRAAACSIYINQTLKEDYDRAFGLPSHVAYTATELRPGKGDKSGGFTVSYLGNLGVGRHEPLCEIARALQEISPEFFLDVYGRIPNETVQQAFDRCPGIRLRGFVSYERVVEVMQTSDLLVHAENFSAFSRADLKYAFSTKIADSLASGTCFLLYAPEELACSRYLRENETAYTVSDPQTLRQTLRLLVEEPGARGCYLERAAELVERNHRAQACARNFQDILRKVAGDLE